MKSLKPLLVLVLFNITLVCGVSAAKIDPVQELIEAFNGEAPNQATLERLFTDAFRERAGDERLLALITQVKEMSGGLRLREIQQGDGLERVAILQDAEGTLLKMSLQVTPDHGIESFSIAPWQAPLEPDEIGLSEAAIVAKLNASIDILVAEDHFSGAVILAKNHLSLLSGAVGDAVKSSGRKNRLDTPINLGSMNKMFTGIAIAQLVASGQLSYTDTVGQHLPDYPQEIVRDQVTIHQLLTHTSGMGSYWNDTYLDHKEKLTQLSDFAELIIEQTPKFEPGQEFHYSNSGPVILGLIVERLTGISYYEYIRRHIYQKAGMSNSDHYPKESPKVAHGYIQTDAGWQDNYSDLGRIGSPAGGGYASANDLLNFARSLFNNTLLDESSREEMLQAQVSLGPPGADYAYGFGVHDDDGIIYIGHNGGAPGINAEFSYFPQLGYTLIVLSNYGHAASPLAKQIRQWLTHSQAANELRKNLTY